MGAFLIDVKVLVELSCWPFQMHDIFYRFDFLIGIWLTILLLFMANTVYWCLFLDSFYWVQVKGLQTLNLPISVSEDVVSHNGNNMQTILILWNGEFWRQIHRFTQIFICAWSTFTISNEETFLQDFRVILKLLLQNCQKIYTWW